MPLSHLLPKSVIVPDFLRLENAVQAKIRDKLK
jgi:hypothetical protein